MSKLRVTMRGEQLGPKFRRSMKRQSDRVRAAMGETAREVAEQIQVRGRANIAAGGNFGSSRWQDGLTAVVTQGGGTRLITVRHAMGAIFGIFEHGGVIRGNPLLWFKPTPGFVDGDPEVISVKQVTIPQKFNVRKISAEVAREIPQIYKKHFAESK